MSTGEACEAAGLVLAAAVALLAIGLVVGIDPLIVALLVMGLSIIMGVVVPQRIKKRQAPPAS